MIANSENKTAIAKNFLQIHPKDNVLVALKDLRENDRIVFANEEIILQNTIAAKHKFAVKDIDAGEQIFMYGVLVGVANEYIPKGGAVTINNIHHASGSYQLGERKTEWEKPDVAKWVSRTFMGYHRSDGSVGTANHWLVIPLVFCENRNINVLKDAMLDQLGYKKVKAYESDVNQLVEMYKAGKSGEEILNAQLAEVATEKLEKRLFPNVDGLKFLLHDMGCGGTRSDSQTLCGLLAGYITHPNVAGATILSLGCQNAQVSILKEQIALRDANFNKPLIVLEQQNEGTEKVMLQKAIKKTFAGLIEANKLQRSPAPLSKICIGLECGGSDGFSGISANPALGYASDMLVALGGSVILAEFPELCGVEQEMSDRCVDVEKAGRFIDLMRVYSRKADEAGSGFYANPSPGNIKDGLITDAIKSAGAAKKAGTSPVADVLDYPEKVTKPGLNLLCTPGNDVESTTAEVGSGANIVLFTTGLGTPTGNPIAPVIKLSTNTKLYNKMPDIIDINCGTIIEGEETIQEAGERILNFVIEVASGNIQPKSVQLGQDDFIPWRRGISL